MNFKNCNPESNPSQLDSLLLHILQNIEKDLGKELNVNSAFRSINYEVSNGRNGSSAHTLGKAVDIHCYNSSERYIIIKSALQQGICRIGIYKTFIHLDVATAKDGKNTQVIWYG